MDTSSDEELYFKEITEKLQCPFTWSMDDVDKDEEPDYHPNDDEDEFPLLQLMRNIMSAYVNAKEPQGENLSLQALEKCNENLNDLIKKSEPAISIKVASYILQATKCFVLFKMNKLEESKEIYNQIKDCTFDDPLDKSTLLACRSLCWSKYHRVGSREAEKFIRQANEINPNYHLWIFILGKNLRRIRRDSTVYSKPSKEESECFMQAYQISKTPVYGTFLAQMYREEKRFAKALDIYEKVFLSNPKSSAIVLRLALGFIQANKLQRAGVCLNNVQEKCSSYSMYWHYRGILNMKLERFDEAAKFLKKALDDKNLPADRTYMQCMVKHDKSFDTTKHLLTMLDKYKTLPEKQIQVIVLELACSYYLKEENIKEAVKYFVHGIEIDPYSKSITCYDSVPVPIKEKNLYNFLQKKVLPKIYENPTENEEDVIEAADAIKKYCEDYFQQFQKNPTELKENDKAEQKLKTRKLKKKNKKATEKIQENNETMTVATIQENNVTDEAMATQQNDNTAEDKTTTPIQDNETKMTIEKIQENNETITAATIQENNMTDEAMATQQNDNTAEDKTTTPVQDNEKTMTTEKIQEKKEADEATIRLKPDARGMTPEEFLLAIETIQKNSMVTVQDNEKTMTTEKIQEKKEADEGTIRLKRMAPEEFLLAIETIQENSMVTAETIGRIEGTE